MGEPCAIIQVESLLGNEVLQFLHGHYLSVVAAVVLLRVEHLLVFGIKCSLVSNGRNIDVLGFAVLLHRSALVGELVPVVGCHRHVHIQEELTV